MSLAPFIGQVAAMVSAAEAGDDRNPPGYVLLERLDLARVDLIAKMAGDHAGIVPRGHGLLSVPKMTDVGSRLRLAHATKRLRQLQERSPVIECDASATR